MRIIAGKHRGRRLLTPKDESIRPTTDFIREALFSILGERMRGAKVLDLFGGTGALSLESLSRGAAMATVCDSSRESIDLIRRNAQAIDEHPIILSADYAVACRRLSGQMFDIVFVDPPYKMHITPVLAAIRECDLCAVGGLVVYEHDKNTPFAPQKGWVVTDERQYGRVALTFLSPHKEIV